MRSGAYVFIVTGPTQYWGTRSQLCALLSESLQLLLQFLLVLLQIHCDALEQSYPIRSFSVECESGDRAPGERSAERTAYRMCIFLQDKADCAQGAPSLRGCRVAEIGDHQQLFPSCPVSACQSLVLVCCRFIPRIIITWMHRVQISTLGYTSMHMLSSYH